MQFEYNPEQLIDEVRQRPGIWDFNHEDYRCKSTRHKLWMEIVEKLVKSQTDDKLSKSDKRELEIQLQKRWKSFRDSYVKFSSGKLRTKRPYIYIKQLSFLSSTQNPYGGLKNRIQKRNRDGDSSDSDSDRKAKSLWKEKKTIKIAKSEMISGDDDDGNDDGDDDNDNSNVEVPMYGEESDMLDITKQTNLPAEFAFAPVDKSEERDADKMFLLSLVPHLKSVPPNLMLDVKLEIMQVLRKYRGQVNSSF